jgi:subfamily B ATP-binding cassette protein MsbA
MHKIKDLFYLSLPYKWNVFFNVIFNLLGVLFNLFSLLLFIPFLSLLFNKVPPIAEKPAFEWSKTALENRLNYEMGQYITQSGPEAALIFIS